MTWMYAWTVSLALFASEIAMLLALGWAGSRLVGGAAATWAVAVVLVACACLVWGLFVAPQAAFDVPTVKYGVKIGLYALAAVLLAATTVPRSVVAAFVGFSLVINVVALLPPVVGAD